MALSNPRIFYGIHSVTPYNVTTGNFFGIIRVLQGSTFSLQGEVNELRGGSSKYAWTTEDGNINAELQISASEYPDFLFELFLGKAPTAVVPEAAGNVSTLTDKNGTSVVAATGLLGAITVSTAADLKFGKYVVKATGAAAISVYKSTNIDDTRGTDASDYSSDLLLVESFTGVGSGSTHVLTNHGITLVAGASAGAMVADDTATFEVRPVSTVGGITATFGGLGDSYSEFGALLYSAKRGNGEMFEIDVFRAKAIGMSLGAQEKAYSSWSVTAKCSYDSSRSGVYSIRHLQPGS